MRLRSPAAIPTTIEAPPPVQKAFETFRFLCTEFGFGFKYIDHKERWREDVLRFRGNGLEVKVFHDWREAQVWAVVKERRFSLRIPTTVGVSALRGESREGMDLAEPMNDLGDLDRIIPKLVEHMHISAERSVARLEQDAQTVRWLLQLGFDDRRIAISKAHINATSEKR